ncbi:Protein ERD1 [Spathaspora sp. JA1]|nr:Protein ERD1 [Spathaspora sp. JA1]
MSDGDTFLFDDLIPLPFRILFTVQLGITFWYLLVSICHYFTPLNILQLINLSYSNHNYTELSTIGSDTSGEFATTIPADKEETTRLIRGIYHDLRAISVVNIICWIIVRTTHGYEWLKILGYILPGVAFGYLFYRVFYKSTPTMGQIRMFTTLKRILTGNINSISMRTNDILISDSFVSYAKVLNDFGLFIWTYYYSSTKSYDYQLEFLILAIPSLIRIKQCYHEIKITGQKQHIFNLLKYSTNFGPLIVNALIKQTLIYSRDIPQEQLLTKLNKLNQYWYIFSSLNSTYSFIWDVKMDWHFGLFDFLFNLRNPYYKFQPLRRNLAFQYKFIYYLVILVDFLLRFIWILKIFIIKEELTGKITYLHIFSTFLFGYDAYSFGYTVVELLEIYRRWIWCFIKLESDWCKLEKVEPIELSQIKQG